MYMDIFIFIFLSISNIKVKNKLIKLIIKECKYNVNQLNKRKLKKMSDVLFLKYVTYRMQKYFCLLEMFLKRSKEILWKKNADIKKSNSLSKLQIKQIKMKNISTMSSLKYCYLLRIIRIFRQNKQNNIFLIDFNLKISFPHRFWHKIN